MNKSLWLFAFCFIGFTAGAQKIDTTLIYGNWEIYSFTDDGQVFYCDSLLRNVTSAIKTLRQQDPKRQISATDSLELIEGMKAMNDDFCKIGAKFDAKGHCSFFLPGDGDGEDKLTKKSGTYKWTSANKIEAQFNDSTLETFLIVALTANKLVISSDSETPGESSNELYLHKK